MNETKRTAQELADDIQAAIAELADGRVFTDLVDAVNTLAAMKAVAFTEQHVQYVTRYGGNCRDCADADGVCLSSGMPCRDAEKAVRHVFRAIAYGVQHGYIPSPLAAPASQAPAEQSEDGRRAARYTYLRGNYLHVSVADHTGDVAFDIECEDIELNSESDGAQLDAAIDAAIAGKDQS